MAEYNGLQFQYGRKQGRLQTKGFTPTDGLYAYVLGSEDQDVVELETGDYVEVSQSLDLTSVNVIRVDSKILQPVMPEEREVVGFTLKKTEVLDHYDWWTGLYAKAIHPAAVTAREADYVIPENTRLRVSVNGGADQDILFPAVESELSASEVADIINAQITGAQAKATSDGTKVILAGTSTGRYATIEVKKVGTGWFDDEDTNSYLRFRDTAYSVVNYGGDDSSALISTTDYFSEADIGLLTNIDGATNPSNNAQRYIIAVPDAKTAVLSDDVVTEIAGFTTTIYGALWQAIVYIDSDEATSILVSANKSVTTNDLCANVSKVTGSHQVTFRLELLGATSFTGVTTFGSATFGSNTFGG